MKHAIQFCARTGLWWRLLPLLALALLLAGCASTLSATVTRFQQWPEGVVGATYQVVPAPVQQNNLEFQSVADTVVANMGPTGLVQAGPGQAARFQVHIAYGTSTSQTTVQRYADPPYDGWFFGPMYGYYGGWGGAFMMGPPVVNVPVQVVKNTLTVRITDTQAQGREVYRATAEILSDAENLVLAMPYLARAVFDGFPGNNGQVIQVSYPRTE